MADGSSKESPLAKRIAWMVAIWAASVTALAIVAYGLRVWIGA